MIRVLVLATPLLIGGCGQLGAQIAVSGLSYVASVNNVGAESLRFVDDKEQRESCQANTKQEKIP